jgi:hypothetical protein
VTPAQVKELEAFLTPEEREELHALAEADLGEVAWRALPGPQTMAADSIADIIGFGGAAGGGKTDLGCGKAWTQHRKAMVLRRVGTELMGILDRFEELFGTDVGRNGQQKVWRTTRPDGEALQIEWASLPNLGDERGFQGRPHDLLWFDEAANFLEAQVRFLMGWVRSTVPGQKKQMLLTFNPPTTSEGRWIVDFFAPWLDKRHPLFPTAPGALRWAATLPDAERGMSKDVWVDDDGKPLTNAPFVITAGRIVYDFDPKDFAPEDVIRPKSRTFIPSRITDNPYLMGTGYLAQLQALPEPLRSQMLKGDFLAGMTDDPWQVIPTAWVEAAQARWKARSPKGEMHTLGVDVARGGKDNTVLASRHVGNWYDEIKLYPGRETPDGPATAGLVVAHVRDRAPILIDVIGVGASPYDTLNSMRLAVHGVNVSEKATATDKSGRLTFLNLRSQLWWQMREELDPANDTGIALPPDPQLAAELCAPRWKLSGMTIQVESREDIVTRVGRSPDRATAVVLARIPMPKVEAIRAMGHTAETVLNYDPMSAMRR